MASDPSSSGPRRSRFHGRVEGAQRNCSTDGCDQPGEFRAPGDREGRSATDGPPPWRWLCLDHVREFNARYNYFSGMSTEEIEAAQRPFAGWERETRAFSADAHTPPPRWADFADPLDAIGAKFRDRMRDAAANRQANTSKHREDGKPISPEDRAALKTLGLAPDADRKALRAAYTRLARCYHPDHNGGDRSHEKALQDVIAAYTHLRKAPAFA